MRVRPASMTLHRVELRHLRYFLAVAEQGSFSRAADLLWVAQPGLSTQVRRLESELGVTLFRRHTRGADLTEAGERLLTEARRVLAAADRVVQMGRDRAAGRVGALRVGLSTVCHWTGTTELLEAFDDRYPAVDLTVIEGAAGTLTDELALGRLDAVVVPRFGDAVSAQGVNLGAERWLALIGEGHPLWGRGPLPISALSGRQIAVTGQSDGAAYDRAVTDVLAELEVPPVLVNGAPGLSPTAMVHDGRTIALVTAATALPSGSVARPLTPRRPLQFGLLRDVGEAPPPLMRFFELAGEVAQRQARLAHPLSPATR